MQFTRKTVRSRPGLSQEEALASLQESPMFRPGTRIAAIKLRGNQWVASLDIPAKLAEFPPKDDSEGSGPPTDDAPEGPPAPDDGGDAPDDGAPDGPPSGDDGGDGGEGKKPSGDDAILHVLTEILHALKGGPAGDMLGGPDDMGPGMGGPPGPPPHGGPAGAGGPPPPHGGGGMPPMGASKLKPGEVPNKPGMLPVGAPAFSSTRTAFGEMPGQAPGGFDPMGAAPGMSEQTPGSVPNPMQNTPGGQCPTCGGPVGPDGTCPQCGMGPDMGGGIASGGTAPAPISTMSPLASHIAKIAGKKATFPISAPEGTSIKAAKAVLEPIAAQYGYRLAQVKYVDNRPRFLLTQR